MFSNRALFLANLLRKVELSVKAQKFGRYVVPVSEFMQQPVNDYGKSFAASICKILGMLSAKDYASKKLTIADCKQAVLEAAPDDKAKSILEKAMDYIMPKEAVSDILYNSKDKSPYSLSEVLTLVYNAIGHIDGDLLSCLYYLGSLIDDKKIPCYNGICCSLVMASLNAIPEVAKEMTTCYLDMLGMVKKEKISCQLLIIMLSIIQMCPQEKRVPLLSESFKDEAKVLQKMLRYSGNLTKILRMISLDERIEFMQKVLQPTSKYWKKMIIWSSEAFADFTKEIKESILYRSEDYDSFLKLVAPDSTQLADILGLSSITERLKFLTDDLRVTPEYLRVIIQNSRQLEEVEQLFFENAREDFRALLLQGASDEYKEKIGVPAESAPVPKM